MSELKPCPFCGGEPQVKTKMSPFTHKEFTGIGCQACGTWDFEINIGKFSENGWNTRPLEDALQKEVDKLCAELKLNSIQISIGNDSIMSLQKRIDELESQLAQVAKENDWMKYPEPPESGAK